MTSFSRWLGLLLFAPVLHPVAAQSIINGPDLDQAGTFYFQLGDGDRLFDPALIQRNFTYGFDDPKREGFVDFRVTVNGDGRVGEADVLGGFYDEALLENALAAIRGSTFKPATVGGEAVAWPRLDMRVLTRGAFLPGVSDGVRAELSKVLELISAREYQEAEALVNRLLSQTATRLFEYALLQDQLATIHLETNHLHEALIASREASMRTAAVLPSIPPDTRIAESDKSYPDEWLNADFYLAAERKHVLLALATNQTGEALDAFARFEAAARLAGATGQIDPIRPAIVEMQTLLDSESEAGSVIKLVNGSWEFTMSNRRIFGVTGLQGSVDHIDVNCLKQVKRRLPFQNDSEWQIPASWGQCTLEFQGESGSQFNLYEYLN